jgi:hypothetical protein
MSGRWCTAQIGLVQSGVLSSGSPQVRATQHRLAQVRLHQTGLAQPTIREVDAAQVAFAQNREREIHLDERDRPQPAFGEHRTQHAAVTKDTVPQCCSPEGTVAEGRSDVLGLTEVDTAEITLGEHHAFGPQPPQIVIAKIVLDEFALRPDGFGVRHAISRAPTGGRSARTQ